MKKILIAGVLFFLFQYAIGQSDGQWLIMNQQYQQDVLIEGVKPPCRQCNPEANNDYFVIFKNGNHYNSRFCYGQNPCPCIPPNPTASTPNTLYLKNDEGSPIIFLYLTNKYEGDDPPGLTVSNSNNNSTGVPEQPVEDRNINEYLMANHDVVKDKDITLIVSNTMLRLSGYKFFRVRFLGVVQDENDPSTIMVNNAFASQDITGSGSQDFVLDSGFSNNEINIVDFISYNYTYINLRPTNNLDAYYPQVSSTNDYWARFVIEGRPDGSASWIELQELNEPIRDSHDPNYIEVEKICQNGNGEHFVFYKVFFQNTNFNPAGQLKVIIELDPRLDPSCISANYWAAGGEGLIPDHCDVEPPNGNTVTFVFDPIKKIQSCPNPKDNQDLSIGILRFCVKVESNVYNPHLIKWDVLSAHTSFDGTEYEIVDQFDIGCTYQKENLPCERELQQCDCQCSSGSNDDPRNCWFLDLFRKKKTKKLPDPKEIEFPD